MSEGVSPDGPAIREGELKTKPAVGIVATEEDAEDVPCAIARARQHGYDVIVTAWASESDGIALAQALDAIVVSPVNGNSTTAAKKDRLAAVARAAGYPGLLYHEDLSGQIDFARSAEALISADCFAMDAHMASPLEQEPSVVVGIPAYNEASTIAGVVTAARDHADEVLVVDDGSADDTASAAETAGATVISHDHNKGYGAALKTIFRQARKCQAEHLVVLDGDGQHSASDIPRLVDTQRETDTEVVIGCRYGTETDTTLPVYRRLGLSVINTLTNISLGLVRPAAQVSDTQSGFRAYSRRVIRSLAEDTTIGNRMSASTDILYHINARGYSIAEVPTTIEYAVENASSRNPLQHGIVLIMNIVRTIEQKRPITALGIPGVVSSLLGCALGYWVIFDYIQSEKFAVGMALGAAVLLISGLLAAFTAIMLHSMALIRDEPVVATQAATTARDAERSGVARTEDAQFGRPENTTSESSGG
jgi:glycosyltransferase involved in cell wall biosynthesis